MNLAFDYGDTRIEFELTYRKRKTMSIMVEPPGVVTVVAPAGTPEDMVIDKVRAKGPWILNKLNEVRDVKSLTINKEFINGESFMYLGRNYSLQLQVDSQMRRPKVEIDQSKLIITTPTRDESRLQKAVETWYRAMASEQVKARVKYFQPKVGAVPNKIIIKDQKKRWGSCSSSGNLYFNWRAVMAPADVLDYLVVHELCHLIQPNHSRDFWNLVLSVMPDYKTRQDWLKKNGIRLSL